MNECIEKLVHEFVIDKNVIIIGDLNVNMLKSNTFGDCLDIIGLTNIVKEPTCFKGVPSLIDLCITNRSRRLNGCISVDTGLSDFHNMICTATKFYVPEMKSTKITYRSYKSFNEDSFVTDLSTAPYHVGEIFNDIDDTYWFFNALTMKIVDEHAPLKTKQIKGRKVPYMNGELRKAINVKNMLKRKYDKCNNQTNWTRYKLQRNIVTKLRKKSMHVYLQNKCKESKTGGGFWEAVKPLVSQKCTKKNDNIILYDTHTCTLVSNKADVCNKFNDYFINVTSNIGTDDRLAPGDNTVSCINSHKHHTSVQNIYKDLRTRNDSEFHFTPVSVNTVKSLMVKLNVKKATGPDLLPAKLLKIG